MKISILVFGLALNFFCSFQALFGSSSYEPVTWQLERLRASFIIELTLEPDVRNHRFNDHILHASLALGASDRILVLVPGFEEFRMRQIRHARLQSYRDSIDKALSALNAVYKFTRDELQPGDNDILLQFLQDLGLKIRRIDSTLKPIVGRICGIEELGLNGLFLGRWGVATDSVDDVYKDLIVAMRPFVLKFHRATAYSINFSNDASETEEGPLGRL